MKVAHLHILQTLHNTKLSEKQQTCPLKRLGFYDLLYSDVSCMLHCGFKLY